MDTQTDTRHHAQIHISASTPVAYHCDLNGGRIALRLSPAYDAVAVYLDGTPDDIVDFAYRILGTMPESE